MGNSANLYTGIPTPFGDNNQFVRVWDTRPEHGGAPEVLKKYSIDAREMIKNQPTRYRYASPGEAVPERTEPTDAEVAEHGRNRQIKDLQAELEKAEQTVGAIRTNIETQIRLLSQP
jgi:hypothetical protein